MTRFDAIAFGARSQPTARTLVVRQPMIFIVTILLSSMFVLAVSCSLLVCQGVRDQLGKQIDAVQVSAYLRPQVTRDEAEGLRGRIERMGTTARATLLPREEALAALVSAGVRPPLAHASALPDVLIVQLKGMALGGPDQTLTRRIEAASRSLSSLDGVDSVKFDERWVAALDRWSALVARMFTTAIWTICTVLAIAIASVHLLGGRAYAGTPPGSAVVSSEVVGRQALATIGLFSGLASLLIVAVLGGLATAFEPRFGQVVQLLVTSAGRSADFLIVGGAAAVLLLSCAATSSGGRQR